jgi:hypothetical protein
MQTLPSRRKCGNAGFGIEMDIGYDFCVSETKEESPLDRLWREYGRPFRAFDDLSLARWLAQTLGQLHGQAWRMSHPLVGAYRLGAQLAHERQIWLQRLVNMPVGYTAAPCCRAPLLPLFTRDIADTGLICQHCGETCGPFAELPEPLRNLIDPWATDYRTIHAVAHWDELKQSQVPDYELAFEDSAQRAERLLADLAHEIVPHLLEQFPAVVWEDQDECLEVRPEDIPL